MTLATTLRITLTCLATLVTVGCRVERTGEEATLATLRAEVASLQLAAAGRLRPDSTMDAILAEGEAVVIGLRTQVVRDILSHAAVRYLADVRLHLHEDVVVTEEDDVRVRIGPIRPNVGQWRLVLTIRRIDARMTAESVQLTVSDSNRIDVVVPVHVREGSGDALLDFQWDAAALTSVVCGDFSVSERFSGYVAPRTVTVRGHFVLEMAGDTVVARPVVTERIPVSPQPTEASWERVRAILNEQNNIFNCGLALSPPKLEALLRDLLTRGFRFRFPQSVLRPLPVPASIVNTVAIDGRTIDIAVRPLPPRLTTEWLWLRAAVDAQRDRPAVSSP